MGVQVPPRTLLMAPCPYESRSSSARTMRLAGWSVGCRPRPGQILTFVLGVGVLLTVAREQLTVDRVRCVNGLPALASAYDVAARRRHRPASPATPTGTDST